MSSRAYWDASIRRGHGKGTLRSLIRRQCVVVDVVVDDDDDLVIVLCLML